MHSRYDLAGRRTLARFSSTVTPSADCTASNAGIDYCYDAVGRLLYETSYGRRLAFDYDAASNRTRITHPDSTYFQYTYDALNRVDQVQLNGSASGTNLIADYAYDAMSRRTQQQQFQTGRARRTSASEALGVMTVGRCLAALSVAIVVAGLSACSIPRNTNAQPIDRPLTDLDLQVGVCRSGDALIDLRPMSLIEANAVVLPVAGRRARIVRESVVVDSLHRGDVTDSAVYDIALEISPTSDIDIDLKFAELGGALVVYWRETYRHRTYRQGLYRFEQDQPVRWCDGTGGVGDIH